MATNMFKKYTESLVREWTVGANVPSGTLVIDANSKPGVTLTASGDTANLTVTSPGGGLSIAWKKKAGVGNRPNAAPVAVDGSWLFTVAGVTAGETVGLGAAGTARGTKVYRISSDGSLTLTSTSNTYVGIIDDCRIIGTTAAVQIGV